MNLDDFISGITILIKQRMQYPCDKGLFKDKECYRMSVEFSPDDSGIMFGNVETIGVSVGSVNTSKVHYFKDYEND